MLDAQVQIGDRRGADGNAGITGAADIVVGLLSYNNAATIGEITRNAQDCLAEHFPQHRCVLVHADGGSKDGTQESAAAGAVNKNDFVQIAYPVYTAQKISPEYYGVPAKANGVQAIFGVAAELNAGACAIIDSTIGVPSRDSIETLVRPITEAKIDFAVPRYVRHKYDAAILNGIVYPLTRALYGKRIHQLIGGDYALAGTVVNYLTKLPRPEGDTTSSNADAWIAVQALAGGFRFGEASLGPRVLSPHEPVPEVSGVLAQALASVLTEMERSAPYWQRIRGSQPVPGFGPAFEPLPDPPPVDPTPMQQSFRLGYQNLLDIYRLVLTPATLVELKRMSLRPADTFHFDDTLWARIVYDFAMAWRLRTMDRDHLLGALTPLYLGWAASWFGAIRDASPQEAEGCLEKLCTAFEAQKSYLISRWRWPDRFNP